MAFNPIKNQIDVVRLAFYLGALTDGLAVIPIMLFPSAGIALFGGDSSQITDAYRYAMGIGASLMAGWTVLLIWGARKPVERRAVLVEFLGVSRPRAVVNLWHIDWIQFYLCFVSDLIREFSFKRRGKRGFGMLLFPRVPDALDPVRPVFG